VSTSAAIDANVTRLLDRVRSAAAASGHDADQIAILVATKTQPISTISDALAALATLPNPIILGENRVQELVGKAPELLPLLELHNAKLHFIGSLQKNKINQLLETPVTCVQTIDSLELAKAISDRCVRQGKNLEVMVQVNISGEASKSGCAPAEAVPLALAIAGLPSLTLTGFMGIGLPPRYNSSDGTQTPIITNDDEIKAGYRTLRKIRDQVFGSGVLGTETATNLSMGMSSDLELAIAEGATIIRPGTAIFGPRHT